MYAESRGEVESVAQRVLDVVGGWVEGKSPGAVTAAALCIALEHLAAVSPAPSRKTIRDLVCPALAELDMVGGQVVAPARCHDSKDDQWMARAGADRRGSCEETCAGHAEPHCWAG